MNIFYPFQKWGDQSYGYCEDKEGNFLDEVEDDIEDWNEWHIDMHNKYDYIIEFCPAENCSLEMYFGKINNRDFFVQLMKNIAYPPNIDWDNIND